MMDDYNGDDDDADYDDDDDDDDDDHSDLQRPVSLRCWEHECDAGLDGSHQGRPRYRSVSRGGITEL